jgi:hypothetical protein
LANWKEQKNTLINTQTRCSMDFSTPFSSHFSGRRLAADSLRMIYYNDQTIAIVELGPEKLLLSCELIEI